VALALAWCVASLLLPNHGDQAAYNWIARTITAGGMPYVDAWDVKGPAASLPFLLTTSLFGSASWGIRPFDVVLVLATAFAIHRTLLPWAGRAAAWLGVVLWILSYGALGFNNTAQPDGWAAMAVMLAAAPALRHDRKPGLASAMGFAVVCGIAAMVKPFYLLYLVAAGMMAWQAPAPSRPVRLGLTLAAALVPVALIVIWLAQGDALDAARDGYLGFNLAKNSGSLIPLVLFNLSYGLLREPSVLLLGVLAAAGLGRLFARGAPTRQQLLLLAVLIAIGVATSLLQRPWYPSRVLPLLPPLAFAAALGLGELFEPDHAPAPALRAVLGATLTLALLVVVREPLADTVRGGRVAVGLRSLQSYEQLYNFHGATAADVRAMAQTLAERTEPGDAGYAWRHLGVMLLAERPAASRLMLPVTLWDDAPEPWRSVFAAEIDSVLASGPTWLLLEAPSARDTLMPELEPLRFLPGTAAKLEARYQLAAVEGPLRLFLRR
jgi:hypothetical protein